MMYPHNKFGKFYGIEIKKRNTCIASLCHPASLTGMSRTRPVMIQAIALQEWVGRIMEGKEVKRKNRTTE